MYADAVVLDEFADIPPKVFPQILRPALVDRRGTCKEHLGQVKAVKVTNKVTNILHRF